MVDRYANYSELESAEREGADFAVSIKSRGTDTVILAPHGGGIEQGTSEVAKAVAGKDLSVGLFEGLDREGNMRFHVTSTHFDEPRCLKLVEKARHVVTLHGQEYDDEVKVFLGGRDTVLGRAIRTALEGAGYEVGHHSDLLGESAANICNRGLTKMGVQLELTRGLRRLLFVSLSAAGRKNPTKELGKFTEAVRRGLRAAGAR